MLSSASATIDRGYYDVSVIDEKFLHNHDLALQSDEPLSEFLDGYMHYGCVINCSGIALGSLNLLEFESPVTDEDLVVLKCLSQVLAIRLSARITHNNIGLEVNVILHDLLDGTLSSPQALALRMKTVKWQDSGTYRILAFEFLRLLFSY